MRVITVLLLAGLLVLPVGCCKRTPEYSESSTSIKVEIGQEFVIKLRSNRTTGYQWRLAKSLDKDILQLVKSKYVAPKTSALGAGGDELWTFKAVGKGRTQISLEYVRLWKKDAPPLKTKNFMVTVR